MFVGVGGGVGVSYWRKSDFLWLAVLSAGVIAIWLGRLCHGEYFLSSDDLVRLHIAREWRQFPTFAQGDAYWLPLPMWVWGLMMVPPWDTEPPLQTLPAAASLLAAVLIAGWPSREPRSVWGPVTAALLLTSPLVLRLSTSCLAETLLIPLALGSIRLGQGAWINPRASRLFLCALSLIGCQMLRYEAWPVSLMAWLALLARHRADRPARLALWAFTPLLLAFPLAWMALQRQRHGDVLSFVTHAADHSIDVPGGYRALIGFQWVALGAPMVVMLGIIWLVVRPRRQRPELIGVVALLGFPLMTTLIGNQVCSVFPERLALPLILGILPMAAAGWSEIQRRGHSVLLPAGLCLIILSNAWFAVTRAENGISADARLAALLVAREHHRGERVLVFDFDLPGESHRLAIQARLPFGDFVAAHYLQSHFPLNLIEARHFGVTKILCRSRRRPEISAPIVSWHRVGRHWWLGAVAPFPEASP